MYSTYVQGKLYYSEVDLKIKMPMAYRDNDIIYYIIIWYWCTYISSITKLNVFDKIKMNIKWNLL